MIVDRLRDMGMSGRKANDLVEGVYAGVSDIVEAERLSSGSIIRAIAAAVGAALIGGIVCRLITIVTEYELGTRSVLRLCDPSSVSKTGNVVPGVGGYLRGIGHCDWQVLRIL